MPDPSAPAPASDRERFVSIDPATGLEIARYEPMGWDEIDAVLARSRRAFASWGRESVARRARRVAPLATALRARSQELATLVTTEMGKPLREALGEVEKCAATIEWLSGNAEALLAPEMLETPYSSSWVQYEPLGTVLAIMPWNYPLWQALRAAVPAMLSGNVVVLKHAPNVTGCALAIQRLLDDTGLGQGVFQTVLMDTALAGQAIADRRVAGVTLTGSTGAGRAVGAIAGRNLKKVVLELGGSDPFIVLEDADVAAAAAAACRGRMQNNGQSCVASKRFIAVEPVAEAFVAAFAEEVARLRVGDPGDLATEVGPMARRDLRDGLQRQLEESLAAGARSITGRGAMARDGWWFEPTVLVDVKPSMAVFDEETFGPLAAVVVAADEDDAVDLANSTEYGLGSSLWTADPDRARRLAPRIEAGMVFVNSIVASDARLPFGGIKASGLGRELSQIGIREFTNIQTVAMA